MDDWTKKNIEAYDRNAQYYAQRAAAGNMEAIINRYLSYVPSGLVLSLGCGPGWDEKRFVEMGMAVIGIDLSEKLLQEAKKNAPRARFLKMDMRHLGFFPESFDGIYCCASLLLLSRGDAQKAIKEMNSVLKKNGVLYLSVKEGRGETRHLLGENMVTQTLFTNNEVQNLLTEYYFEVAESFRTENKRNPDQSWLNYFARKRKNL